MANPSNFEYTLAQEHLLNRQHVHPAEGYRNFRGRDPKVEALMMKRGFSS